MYYYVKNMQGDVTSIVDSSNACVAQYMYDSWGTAIKVLDGNGTSQSTNLTHIANKNPIRYRGYYYDVETKFYYLQSRYYDPFSARFVNADDAGIVGESYGSLDNVNAFAYCGNNPITAVDPSGYDSYIIYENNADAGQKKPKKYPWSEDEYYKFEDEAKIVQPRLTAWYGTPTHLISVNTAIDFKKKWNAWVGKDANHKNTVAIDQIYIIMHGSIMGSTPSGATRSPVATGYMYFTKSDDSRIMARATAGVTPRSKDRLVDKLDAKKMKKLVFSSCNTANPDCYSIAKAFMTHMTSIKIVVGFDGGALFDYYDNGGTLKAGTGSQTTWLKYVPKDRKGNPIRKRLGRRTYENGKWDKS